MFEKSAPIRAQRVRETYARLRGFKGASSKGYSSGDRRWKEGWSDIPTLKFLCRKMSNYCVTARDQCVEQDGGFLAQKVAISTIAAPGFEEMVMDTCLYPYHGIRQGYPRELHLFQLHYILNIFEFPN